MESSHFRRSPHGRAAFDRLPGRELTTALVILGAALAVLRAQPPPSRDAPSLQPTAAIRGRVVAADTHEPIRKARVDLVATLGDRRDPVYADDEGRFEFTGVAAGRYTLSAWKSGYAVTTFGARTFWEPATVIALEAGQSASGFEIGLVKGAAIAGRVTDDAGEPLADMQVSVGRAASVNGRLQFHAVSLPRGTDDRGEYRIGGLPPGTYFVNVFGRAAPSAAMADADSAQRTRNTFYPQTPFLSQASPVVLRAGEEVGSVDVMFTLDALVTPTISGRVIDPSGSAVRGSLLVTPSGDGVAAAVRVMMAGIQESGEFNLRVVPGDYVLTAQTDDLIARTRVTVDRSDVSGVLLTLVKGGRVTGRVVFEGTSRRPEGFEVTAIPPEQVGGVEPPRINYQPARIRADGSFVLSRLIGTLDLRVMPETRGWRPKSITLGARNVLDVPIEFKGGEDVRDVLIVMTDRTSALTGTVTGSSETGPAALSVLVFPSDSRQAHRARWLRPDQHGRFLVHDLSPGDYLVALAAEVDDLHWQTAAYLDRFRQAATRVVLGDGETKSIALEWTATR